MLDTQARARTHAQTHTRTNTHLGSAFSYATTLTASNVYNYSQNQNIARLTNAFYEICMASMKILHGAV